MEKEIEEERISYLEVLALYRDEERGSRTIFRINGKEAQKLIITTSGDSNLSYCNKLPEFDNKEGERFNIEEGYELQVEIEGSLDIYVLTTESPMPGD